MQADWEMEIGADAPVIEANWSGHVDLRAHPKLAATLPEVQLLPRMAEILSRLNAPQSPLWSSKCDVWEVKSLADVGFDHFDLEAGASETHTVIASYIDLLPQQEQPWKIPSHAEHIAKSLCAQLTAAQQKCCRIDLIIRRAIFAHDVSNFGITAYCTACGIDQFSAQTAHVRALNAFTDAALFQGGHMKAKSR